MYESEVREHALIAKREQEQPLPSNHDQPSSERSALFRVLTPK